MVENGKELFRWETKLLLEVFALPVGDKQLCLLQMRPWVKLVLCISLILPIMLKIVC